MNRYRAIVHGLGLESIEVNPPLDGWVSGMKDMKSSIEKMVVTRNGLHSASDIRGGFVQRHIVASLLTSKCYGKSRKACPHNCDVHSLNLVRRTCPRPNEGFVR